MPHMPVSLFWAPLIGILKWTRTWWSRVDDKKVKEREPEGRGEREREGKRQTDMGTQALMEQRCFNDLSVSTYRLLFKKFLSTVIKIRKPNI